MISSIPASKTDAHEWKLEKPLSQKVDNADVYNYVKTMLSDEVKEKLTKSNLLENDVYKAFDALLTKSGLELNKREVVKVLDKNKEGTPCYRYYKVDQKKDGDEFAFDDDDVLYEKAEDIMEDIIENINIVNKIESTQLGYQGKKSVESFTPYVGTIGIKSIETQKKIDFLKQTDKKDTSLIRKVIR